jgi:type IV secretory pathway TrbF-like protein
MNQTTKQTTKQPRWWMVISFVGMIALMLILGSVFAVPQRFVVPVIVVISLVGGTMALWMRANSKAAGDEWWQDDSSSGWRDMKF